MPSVNPASPPNLFKRIFQVLCSLKFAVITILAIAASVALGTIYESLYDTPTAQYWVYRSLWFRGVLFLFGVNIFCVALSRYPWKRHHVPFLLAHLGILLLLFGSWVTDRFAIDGSMRITEGETSSVVELDSSQLIIAEGNKAYTIPVDWRPHNADFKPIDVNSAAPELRVDLKVQQYLTHAEPEYDFVPKETSGVAWDQMVPAIKVKMTGGPMRMSQSFWLWAGDGNWSTVQAGPAMLTLAGQTKPESGKPLLIFSQEKDGGMSFKAFSSAGKKKAGKFSKGKVEGSVIDPGWKGGVSLAVEKWIPYARLQAQYKPSRVLYGNRAPPAAIQLVTGKGGPGSEIWLGLGERASFYLDPGRRLDVGFFPKRVILPFAVRLERFQIDHYEGTRDPSEYSSKVTLIDQEQGTQQTVISMNQPLYAKGITLYQSSYEEASPRPVTSIFSVNRDPGRPWKYIGSILIVVGSIMLFVRKYRKAQQSKKLAQERVV